MSKAKKSPFEMTPDEEKKYETINAASWEIEELLDEEDLKDHAMDILVYATYHVIEGKHINGGKKAIMLAVDEHCIALKKAARAFLKNLAQDDED